MFKARGQPGVWYGYITIDEVTYKIDAKHVGERQNKHFEGTVKRHLKADQRQLFSGEGTLSQRMTDAIRRDHAAEGAAMIKRAQLDTGFDDDDLPEEL